MIQLEQKVRIALWKKRKLLTWKQAFSTAGYTELSFWVDVIIYVAQCGGKKCTSCQTSEGYRVSLRPPPPHQLLPSSFSFFHQSCSPLSFPYLSFAQCTPSHRHTQHSRSEAEGLKRGRCLEKVELGHIVRSIIQESLRDFFFLVLVLLSGTPTLS